MECKHEFTMCRLCLCESESLIDIFQVNEWFGYVAAVVIRDLLQLQVSETDGYPHVVCSVCLGKMSDFKQFKQQCQNSKDTYDNVFMSHDCEAEYPADIESSTSIKTEPDERANYFCTTTEVYLNPVKPEEDEIITDDISPQVASTLEDEETFMLKLERNSEAQGGSDRLMGELTPLKVEERGSKKEYFKCNDCRMDFETKQVLTMHLKVHGYVLNEESSSEEIDLQVNTNVSSGSKSIKNEVHEKMSDNMNDVGVMKHVCDTCGKVFDRIGHLKTHSRIHSGEKPFHCDICNKRFNVKRNLKRHIASHSGEKAFTCDICQKRFTNKQHLNVHKLTHSGEKPYMCEVCFKGFTQNINRIVHMRIHTGEKPYKCKECKKSFSISTHLKRHLSIHSQEKPYECTVCNKHFVTHYELLRHLRIHSQ